MTALRLGVSLAILYLIWAGIVKAAILPEFVLPMPTEVLRTLWKERGVFLEAGGYTLLNMLAGAGVGITLGIVTGIAIAFSKPLQWIFAPYLVIFQSFPREALFPLMVLWLGFGPTPKIVNAALLSFFPVAILTVDGLIKTRSDYVALIRGWGATRFEEFIHCRLQAYIPTLVSAVKVAVPLALIGAVIGEFLGSDQGLGYLITTSGSEFRPDRAFAALIALVLIGLATRGLLQAIQMTFLDRFYQE